MNTQTLPCTRHGHNLSGRHWIYSDCICLFSSTTCLRAPSTKGGLLQMNVSRLCFTACGVMYCLTLTKAQSNRDSNSSSVVIT